MAQYWGELARRLADYYVLPMRVQDYSEALQGYTDDLLGRYGDLMRQEGLGRGIGKYCCRAIVLYNLNMNINQIEVKTKSMTY